MTSFATRLLEARSTAGLTQKDLADGAGISSVQLSRYETGKSQPRPPVLAQLARVLGVQPAWLANGSATGDNERAAIGNALLKIQIPNEMLARLEATASESSRTLNEEIRWRLGLSLDEVPYALSFNPILGVQNPDGSTTPMSLADWVAREADRRADERERKRSLKMPKP